MAAAGLLLDLFPCTNYTKTTLTNHSPQDRMATRRQKSGGEEAKREEQLQPSKEKEEKSKSWRSGQGA